MIYRIARANCYRWSSVYTEASALSATWLTTVESPSAPATAGATSDLASGASFAPALGTYSCSLPRSSVAIFDDAV